MSPGDEPSQGAPDPSPSTTSVATRRGPRRRTLLAVLGVAGVISLVGASLIRLPYYALRPGQVRIAEPMIDLGGGERDPEVGKLAFVTVAVDGRVTLSQALAGWLDAAVAIVPEDWILRGQTPQQSGQHNQVLMADSKELAVDVALSCLGVARPGGARVAAVAAVSVAAGVLAVGDVVVGVDGVAIIEAEGFVDRVRRAAPGERLVLRVVPAEVLAEPGPDGRRVQLGDAIDRAVEVPVVLGADGQDASQARLGVNARNAYDVSYPGAVSIDSGQVGGPSAGLAYALTVIDLLTEGDLTGGTNVVATGTMALDGSVWPIGGIEQKAVAVRRSGAKVFLVPSGQTEAELREARRLAGDLELVPVASLGEALVALADRGGAPVRLPVLGGGAPRTGQGCVTPGGSRS